MFLGDNDNSFELFIDAYKIKVFTYNQFYTLGFVADNNNDFWRKEHRIENIEFKLS